VLLVQLICVPAIDVQIALTSEESFPVGRSSILLLIAPSIDLIVNCCCARGCCSVLYVLAAALVASGRTSVSLFCSGSFCSTTPIDYDDHINSNMHHYKGSEAFHKNLLHVIDIYRLFVATAAADSCNVALSFAASAARHANVLAAEGPMIKALRKRVFVSRLMERDALSVLTRG
jgi:hypothetical protein